MCWRYMFGSEAVPAALFGVLLFLVPETPRYLAMTHQGWVSRKQWENFLHPNALEKDSYFIENMQAVADANSLPLLRAKYGGCAGRPAERIVNIAHGDQFRPVETRKAVGTINMYDLVQSAAGRDERRSLTV